MARRKREDAYGRALDLWQAPEGAGEPLVCVATTFTFDATFFETECVGRFLQMDTHPSESESVAYLIEREEKLAGARVHTLVDRRHARDKQSLRWDVLGVLVPRAVQHAKVSLLAWAHHVRVIVGSGNLTEPGYRKNVEVFGAMDVSREHGGNKDGLAATLDFLRALIPLAIGTDDANTPKRRLAESLDRVRALVNRWPVAMEAVQGQPVFALPTRGVAEQIESLIPSGGPAREAWVTSPFFDTGPNFKKAGEVLLSLIAKKGPRDVSLCVRTEDLPNGMVRVYAPKGLVDLLQDRTTVNVYPLKAEQQGERRFVHSKLQLLGNDTWSLLMIGSSNFTAAGLAGGTGQGNCEANLVYVSRATRPEAEQMQDIWPDYEEEPLDTASASFIWDPQDEKSDEGGAADIPLPAAFQEALFVPGADAHMKIALGTGLPDQWTIRSSDGETLLQSAGAGAGVHVVVWNTRSTPFVLDVSWSSNGLDVVAGWPVNVSNPAALPPPEVLRTLSLNELLEILASTRSLPAAVVHVLQKRIKGRSLDEILDPLKRLDSQAFLLRRTKRVARALDRLRERLERPALTRDAFEWRLSGAIGPMALAGAFVREARLPGEAKFCLAELALALYRVSPDNPATGGLAVAVIKECLAAAIQQIDSIARDLGPHEATPLDDYVNAAFEKAGAR